MKNLKLKLKEIWAKWNRPMTDEELRHMREWNGGQNGIKPCPCCNKRHTNVSESNTGPR